MQIRRVRLLSLGADQAEPDQIDATIREATKLGGTNLWVLMFAIVIASVGLNVNSTAVIIGAMLISPLMGPIIGIGYGAGIHDYQLIRRAFRNLAIFVAISLLASTAYFLLSPLSQAYSELLARTSPTLWDVLIAFFGGAAGMIGLTRKEKTTLIPGVAIATALMPPLCTAGYGLATAQPQFFLGAFYLFLINGVFIALATLAVVRILRLPFKMVPTHGALWRGRWLISLAITATLAPSAYLAYRLVQDQVFVARAERFIRTVFPPREDALLVAQNIDPSKRTMILTMFGSGVSNELELGAIQRLGEFGLGGATLTVRHPVESQVDPQALKAELRKDLVQGVMELSSVTKDNAARIAVLEQRLKGIEGSGAAALAPVETDIRKQFPTVRAVRLVRHGERKVLAVLDAEALPAAERLRLQRWLQQRLPDAQVELMIGKFSP
ncbi:MAG: DUF389 domain-containing protein [Hylemonella sp.]|nr:DUF389 domain-containing protein [Hylemonella sp.]